MSMLFATSHSPPEAYLVPVICNASDIYRRVLLGIDWSSPRGKGQAKSYEDRWQGGEAESAEGERSDRSCRSDGMMEKKRGKGHRDYGFLLLGVQTRTGCTAGRLTGAEFKMMIRHEKEADAKL